MTMIKCNPNLIKIHRSYTFEELASVLAVHKNTVSNWVKDGLHCLKDRRPYLILGHEAKTYLKTKKASRKQKCNADELYCMRCKRPSKPFDNYLEYSSLTGTKGCLTGFCNHCECTINKFISHANLSSYELIFEITLPIAKKHIND
jgi:hypothetical protein